MKYFRKFLLLFCFIALIGAFIYIMQIKKDSDKLVSNSTIVENVKNDNSNLETDEDKTEINSETVENAKSDNSNLEMDEDKTEINSGTEENTETYAYMKCSDYLADNPDILGMIKQGEDVQFSFGIVKPRDNPNYNNYNEIMEDLAKELGAEEKNGTYLYRHARNSVGGNSAYFSWRFIVNDIEYLIFVKDNDSSECWKVGVTRYNNN